LACLCMAHLAASGVLPAADRASACDVIVVVHTVVKLLGEPHKGVREGVPKVLSALMREREDLHRVVVESGALATLVEHCAVASTPARMVQHALHVFIHLSAVREEGRQAVVESGAVPLVARGLGSASPHVRAAACGCLRNLSRSVRNLRTCLRDANITRPLCVLLEDPLGGTDVVAAAAVCNIVLEFSPMRVDVLACGGVPVLVRLLGSAQQPLRVNALWALKNLSYLADRSIKEAVLRELGDSRLCALCDSAREDPCIVEQALGLVRNMLAGGEDHVQMVLDAFGGDVIASLEASLSSKSAGGEVHRQALYCVCNIAAGSAAHKALVLASEPAIDSLQVHVLRGIGPTRLAGLWCLANLTSESATGWYPSGDARARVLRDLGIEDSLWELLGRTSEVDAECQHRLLTVLRQMKGESVHEEGRFSSLSPTFSVDSPQSGILAGTRLPPALLPRPAPPFEEEFDDSVLQLSAQDLQQI